LPSQGSEGAYYYLTVQNCIKGYNGVYWFEDALSDLQYFSMRHTEAELWSYVKTIGNHQEEVDKEASIAYTAPGLRRYLPTVCLNTQLYRSMGMSL